VSIDRFEASQEDNPFSLPVPTVYRVLLVELLTLINEDTPVLCVPEEKRG